MKTYKLLLLPLLAFFLVSCDGKISPETANGFKGEYWMKTTVCTMYQGQVTEERGPVWSPVSIYEEDGCLLVRTDRFGAPDTVTTSGVKHEYILSYPDHPNYIHPSKNGDVLENLMLDSTEIIPVNITVYLYLVDGFLSTIRNGAELRSLPIKVKSCSATVLNLYDFKPFRVALIDSNWKFLAEVDASYKYGPMVKNGDVITWEVTMPFDFLESYSAHEQVDKIVHKNILYKK